MSGLDLSMLDGSFNPLNIIATMYYRWKFSKENPTFFNPEGLLVFCSGQGAGKTLSLVNYAINVMNRYPFSIMCTNVQIKDFPTNCYYELEEYIEDGFEKKAVHYKLFSTNEIVKTVITWDDKKGDNQCQIINNKPGLRIIIDYDGINCIKTLQNGIEGILYIIDEIHLEFNSLESKNVPIEIMVEVSQQRKQRKHIVGSSQVFMRMAKPLREQIKNVVICKNFFRLIQFNRLIDGEHAHEEDGELKYDTSKISVWFHSPKLYKSYDTMKKMKRYSKEWNGTVQKNIY